MVSGSLPPARATLERQATTADADLFFPVRFNLARSLLETGELAEALLVLDEGESAFTDLHDSLGQLRYPWLRGRIAAARREVPEAEALLQRTRNGFVHAGMGFDAALVSLDLAELYLRTGRNQEARRLAEEVVPVLAAQDFRPEALATLRVFT